MNINRRNVLKLTVGSSLAMPALMRNAYSQERAVHIGIYNSQLGKVVQREIIPNFERDFKCRVYTIEGATLSNIAALRTTRETPRFSAMMMDDVGVQQAKQEGLIEKLDPAKIPNLENVYPRFLFEDSYGVAVSVSAAGMFMNPNAPTTKGLNSYEQLFDPKFKQRLILSSPKYTSSVLFVMFMASLATGKPIKEAQYLVDQGWDKLKELKPSVLTVFENEANVMMVPQGQADVGGIEYTKAIYPHTMKNVPITLAPMKEGFFTGINSITLAKNAPDPELGNAFINRMLDKDVMKLLGEQTVSAPSVKDITFGPDFEKYLPYPLSKMDDMQLVTPDWTFVNAKRGDILERYNQILSA